MCSDKTSAVWYEAGSSQQTKATLWVKDGVLYVENEDGKKYHVAINEVEVSSRLGNIPRQLTLPTGEALNVANNDYVDRYIAASNRSRFIYVLETYHRWVISIVLLGAAMLYYLFTYGLPAAANQISQQIPADYVDNLGQVVYKSLQQEELLIASQLSQEQQARVQRLWAEVRQDFPDTEQHQLKLKLHRFSIYQMDDVPNAFALPNGIIVLTDALVNLLSDDEIKAVIAHEIGHVHLRHSLRGIIQASGIAVMVTALFGDYSGLSLVPIFLSQAKYSRDFEREADCFAYQYLNQHGMSGALIGEALRKMEKGDSSSHEDEEHQHENDDDGDGVDWGQILTLLSTHPHTEERSDLAKNCSA